MNGRYFQNSGETGHIAEEEFLGTCRVSWDGKMYVSYRDAMNMARDNQADNPSAPRLAGARMLHKAVAHELGISDSAELKLYSAVGTPLDRLHGVDAWFEFKGIVITIDVTMSEQKERAKANVVVNLNDSAFDFEFSAKDIADAFFWKNQPTVHAPALTFGKETYVPVSM
ncbi:MAG: hypothetical protein KBC33_01020 [Candidatus Pacebacteria bacterium]|nr:hypothetical protein [Candidatus Paceibacterota bacterium]